MLTFVDSIQTFIHSGNLSLQKIHSKEMLKTSPFGRLKFPFEFSLFSRISCSLQHYTTTPVRMNNISCVLSLFLFHWKKFIVMFSRYVLSTIIWLLRHISRWRTWRRTVKESRCVECLNNSTKNVDLSITLTHFLQRPNARKSAQLLRLRQISPLALKVILFFYYSIIFLANVWYLSNQERGLRPVSGSFYKKESVLRVTPPCSSAKHGLNFICPWVKTLTMCF